MNDIARITQKARLGRVQAMTMLDAIRNGHPIEAGLTSADAEEILTSNIALFDETIERLARYAAAGANRALSPDEAKLQLDLLIAEIEALEGAAQRHPTVVSALDILKEAKAMLKDDPDATQL